MAQPGGSALRGWARFCGGGGAGCAGRKTTPPTSRSMDKNSRSFAATFFGGGSGFLFDFGNGAGAARTEDEASSSASKDSRFTAVSSLGALVRPGQAPAVLRDVRNGSTLSRKKGARLRALNEPLGALR